MCRPEPVRLSVAGWRQFQILMALMMMAAAMVVGEGMSTSLAGDGGDGKPMPVYLPRKRCEICVTVLMRKMAQVDHLCSGMEHYFETCNDVIASMLHWYPNVIYWSWSGGCDMRMQDGLVQRVRPCPAHAICGWLTSPNYHVAFCPWDANFRAPGLEDSLYPFAQRPSDSMPPLGGPQGMGFTTNMGMKGTPQPYVKP